MDEELRKMLMQIMEGQIEIKSDIKNIDTRLTKIEVIQEEIKTRVNTLAELHELHKQQNEMSFKNTMLL